ncbi:histidine kinase [Sphingomonas donggukensis]|uniref:histidine kinase n=1 Tax=Sphingomonas donggukensis TaxID=2949093 RepID=A0ABY4TWX0_9SPHN|nr:histidine kinase dimerization/phosphoacceptor domain -containing protein [Sphingomonas donggukensis]URW76898.1 histidine kinase [Sphingomonas donggukensis]
MTIERPAARRDGSFARWPTGAKVFAILSAALLPLALIVVAAAFQTTRTADLENRTRLRVAATEASRTLAIELLGDVNALRSALRAIESDPADAPSCARVRGIFAPATSTGTAFGIYDAAGTLRCGQIVPDAVLPEADGLHAEVLPGRGLTLTLSGSRGQARASVFFPARFLAEISRPSGFVAPYSLELTSPRDRLVLRPLDDMALLRTDRRIVDIGFDGLQLDMATAAAPITSPALVAMLLPIVMWVVASVIGWIVVDASLIRPLRRLRRGVDAYKPGTVFDTVSIGTIPAQEIRELGDTFRGLSQTLVAHEADLAEGLVRQTKLTREVHHRVKNNLQVIASLINFHARSSPSPEVAGAYATIQRRVDALAVVHRNHFAEMEVNRGLSLRSVIGELSANIRATAPDASAQLGITLEVEPFLVSQDVAVAVAFLITELVELAMSVQPAAQVRVSLSAGETPERAVMRVSSPALVEGEALSAALRDRYGRIIEGLSRQLRSKLHHEPLAGAYEIAIAVLGRD